MTINYTTLLGLAEPVTGTETGTWGDDVNRGITDYLDIAIAGTQTISGTQTAVTLSLTNGSSAGSNITQAGTSATGSAQYAVINCTGSPASLLTVTVPASSRIYHVINATSTSQSVKIVGAGPTTGVTIVSGEKATVVWNGSDYVKISNTSGSASFVDLTVSGNLTISSGTANGVAYLNGSKVLTTSTSFYFDGTKLALAGGNAPTQMLNLYQSGSTQTVLAAGNSNTGLNGTYFGVDTAGNAIINQTQALATIFSISGSEQMRLTSTGLGIGTSSPSAKLHIAGSTFRHNDATNSYGYTISAASNTTTLATLFGGSSFAIQTGASGTNQFLLDSSGNLGIGTSSPVYKLDVRGVLGAGNGTITGGISYSTRTEIGSFSNHNLGLISNGTTQAILDTSGNLGLGVTPSAWYSTWKAFELNAGAISSNGLTLFQLFQNSYVNASGNYTYKASAAASRYDQNSGAHQWYTAPSGTAGNAISFTQAMTLDASGNLLVGTTSASAGKFYIRYDTSGSNTVIQTQNETSGGRHLSFRTNGNSEVGSITATAAGTTYNTASDYRLKNVIGAVTGAGERIDALEPVEYEWKADGTRTRGFLAHKFQEVYAGSVTGSKDAVDAEGKPVYQAMQAGSSEVIADLVAEIQSLRKRLAAAGI